MSKDAQEHAAIARPTCDLKTSELWYVQMLELR